MLCPPNGWQSKIAASTICRCATRRLATQRSVSAARHQSPSDAGERWSRSCSALKPSTSRKEFEFARSARAWQDQFDVRLKVKMAVVSTSNPQTSQDQELRTHRSLTYFDDVAAIMASPQFVQRRSGFPLPRVT